MFKDLSLESRNINTQNCAPIQCTVWPRNEENLGGGGGKWGCTGEKRPVKLIPRVDLISRSRDAAGDSPGAGTDGAG